MSSAASSAAKIASMPPIGAIKNQTNPPNSPNVAQKHAVHQQCMMGNTTVPPRIFHVPLTLILLTFLACQSDMTARSIVAGATERYQGTKMIENDNTETSRIRLRERVYINVNARVSIYTCTYIYLTYHHSDNLWS